MTTTTRPDGRPQTRPARSLAKTPTGIRGFDDLTSGGLPRGRPSLVTGASGSGKTLFCVEFLVRGAQEFDEPGVLLSFEESATDLADNVASLGFDLAELEEQGHLVVDAFRVDAAEIVATGAFDLEGLFLRLQSAVDAVGAKRVVLDTIEVLFTALGNEGIVRSEMGRLFRWLKDRGLTTLVTGERGREGQLTRFGIEEYVSDCVVVLDQRVIDDVSTRRLRVVKYRGSGHGTNEYPFRITERGLAVLPITSVGLAYGAPSERISTGLPQLDAMVGGGVYRGSVLLVSGASGSGKTTIAANVVDAACARGEHALFMSFEESPEQLIRNMRSVGLDLRRWADEGLLTLWCERATTSGLESHLGHLELLLEDEQPAVVALDAIAGMARAGAASEVMSAVAREMDLLKVRGITTVLTALNHGGDVETSEFGLSSLIDTWLLLRNVESDGERNRVLTVVKSRGTAHSNQVREFVITDHGAELVDVYIGPEGVLTGSARTMALAAEEARATHTDDVDRRRMALARRSSELAAQLTVLQEQLAAGSAELERLLAEEVGAGEALEGLRSASARTRSTDGAAPTGRGV
ncbi:MAG: circadian clock protein KaiC [Mycobacteriales bacterium]